MTLSLSVLLKGVKPVAGKSDGQADDRTQRVSSSTRSFDAARAPMVMVVWFRLRSRTASDTVSRASTSTD